MPNRKAPRPTEGARPRPPKKPASFHLEKYIREKKVRRAYEKCLPRLGRRPYTVDAFERAMRFLYRRGIAEALENDPRVERVPTTCGGRRQYRLRQTAPECAQEAPGRTQTPSDAASPGFPLEDSEGGCASA